MNRRKLLALILIPTLTAAGLVAAHAAWSPHHGPHAGGWGGPDRHGHFCERGGAGHVDHVISYVEDALDLRDDQQSAWEAMVRSLRDGGQRIEALCTRLGETRVSGVAPETVELAEEAMETGLRVLRHFRPRFEAFHATLTEEQRKALADLHGRRRMR